MFCTDFAGRDYNTYRTAQTVMDGTAVFFQDLSECTEHDSIISPVVCLVITGFRNQCSGHGCDYRRR